MIIDPMALAALWKQAFGDPDAYIQTFFQVGFDPHRCQTIDIDGQLAAALYWFDCDWNRKKVAYIYAVAVDTQFRGQGLCRQLMEKTHKVLHAQKYDGAVLVPATQPLVGMYEKMGYVGICPMSQMTILPADTPVTVQKISWQDYGALRQKYLPENSVAHRARALQFFDTYGQFYAFDGGCFCAAWEEKTLHVQEFLGSADLLPEIISALEAEKAMVRLPGGNTPFAMYHSLTQCQALPAYFGIPLD